MTDLDAARRRLVAPLEAAGYTFRAENPDTDRLFFVRGLPPAGLGRTHHLHLMEAAHGAIRHIAFRDYLRDHPQAAGRYAALKQDLALRFRTDRRAYTEGKGKFIEAILEQAIEATPANGPR